MKTVEISIRIINNAEKNSEAFYFERSKIKSVLRINIQTAEEKNTLISDATKFLEEQL